MLNFAGVPKFGKFYYRNDRGRDRTVTHMHGFAGKHIHMQEIQWTLNGDIVVSPT